jgi:3-oxoacyl-[acyl-carrier protein] reductase
MVDGLQKVFDMNLGLAGKRVLITGASQGVGKATAIEFLEEGSSVAIVARGSKRLNALDHKLGQHYGVSKVISSVCDCTNEGDLISLSNLIKKKWGGIDIVVANVGDGRSVVDPIPSSDQWKKVWNSNFESALLTSRSFLPMLEDSKGSLLFVSSIAGMEAFGAPVDYSTAKASIIALAKNLSRKLTHVRVNVVAPGNVYFKGGVWDDKIKQDEGRVNSIIQETVPMKRLASPEEIASPIVFLCSKQASFITGSTIVIDGGQTVGVL